jgi:hypothetical protein
MFRRVDAIPQPNVVGSDLGQSFLWYEKNLYNTRIQHTTESVRNDELTSPFPHRRTGTKSLSSAHSPSSQQHRPRDPPTAV